MSDTQTLGLASATASPGSPVSLGASVPPHLNGRYRLLEFRGAGGAGEVYLGQDSYLDRLVAIKRLRPEVASPEARVQLAHEARINARLEHPNIVRVYDFLSVGGTDFIVSEYVDGPSLAESGGLGLDIDQQLTRALQISRGLAFAHAAGVVHLDLKPENVLIGRDGVPKIADFGVARRIDAGERHEASGITIRGTLRTMSPEQTRACPADARSDLFSFGTLLYELFAGLSPFHARGHAAETIRRIRELRPLPLRELRPEVPAALSELVQRLHCKDVADRPASAREVEAVLSDLLERRSRRLSADFRKPPIERRVLSVLTCELAIDSPSTIEGCESYLRMLTRFQQLMAAIVERREGQVLNAVGQRTTICLGYPKAHDNNCERAARLLLELRRAWSQDVVGERVPLRAGLDVGDALLSGNVAASPSLAVSEALCHAAQPGEFLVSAAAQRILRRFFGFEGRGELCVPRTSQSIQSVHYHELREASAPASLTPASAQASAPAVIGRQRELEALASAWRSCQAGCLEVVFLVGAAGIGKSRLVSSFAESITASGAEVLRLLARPEDQYSPFAPFGALLSREEDAEPASRVRDRELNAFATTGLDAVSDEPGQAAMGNYRQRIIDAGLAALVGKAGAPPLLVVVEDAHWLDHSSLALLSSLRTRRMERPLLLVLSGRPECQNELSSALRGQALTVSRLSARDALDLVRAMPGGRNLSQRTAARIVEAAEGLPLLLEELTLSLSEPEGTGTQRFLDVPSSLTESLDRRLEGLGRARDTVDLLAALGRESVVSILEKLSGLEPPELEAQLSRLHAAGLVFEHGAGGPRRTLVFRHRLLGDAIYERLPPARREQLHRRIADVVQTSFQSWLLERPDLFVLHFARAGRWLEAVELSVRAGEHAARRSCHFEACAHFRAALDLLRCSGLSHEDKQRQQQQIERLLCPSLNASNASPAHPQQPHARTLSASAPQRAGSEPLSELWAAFTFASLRHDATEVSQGLARLGALEPTPGRDCLLSLAHGHVAFYRGELGCAEHDLRAAQQLLAKAEDRAVVASCGQELLIDAPCYLAFVYMLRADEQRAGEQRRVAELVSQASPIARGFSTFFGTIRGLVLREHESAPGLRQQQERVRELLAAAERLHHPIFHGVAELALGRIEHARGAGEEGLIRMRRGYDLYEETGAQLGLAQFAGFVVEAHLEGRQLSAARELLERVRPAASHAYARFYRPELLRLEAELLIAEGRKQAARELLDAVARARASASDLGSEALLFSQRIEETLARLDAGASLVLA